MSTLTPDDGVADKATKRPLCNHRTTLKFVAIKVLVTVGMLQSILFKLLGGPTANFWENVALVLESVALGVLLHRAFPAEELPGSLATGSLM